VARAEAASESDGQRRLADAAAAVDRHHGRRDDPPRREGDRLERLHQ
jgi:hypothetical protein